MFPCSDHHLPSKEAVPGSSSDGSRLAQMALGDLCLAPFTLVLLGGLYGLTAQPPLCVHASEHMGLCFSRGGRTRALLVHLPRPHLSTQALRVVWVLGADICPFLSPKDGSLKAVLRLWAVCAQNQSRCQDAATQSPRSQLTRRLPQSELATPSAAAPSLCTYLSTSAPCIRPGRGPSL